MGKIEDLKKLVDLLNDDEVDVEMEVIVGKDNLSKRLKELEEEGFSLTEEDLDDLEEEEEEDSSDDTEDDIDELRKKAREQHKEIVKEFGEELANAIVDYAGYCAMIVNLVRCDIPIDHEIVDHYNDLCKKVHPESCNPMVKAVAYVSMQEMIKEGKKSLG